MRFPLPSKKTILALVRLLVFNVAGMWVWALYIYNGYIQQSRIAEHLSSYSYQIAEIPLWVDVLWGVFLFGLTSVFSPTISEIRKHKKIFRAFAGFLVFLSLLIGIAYAFGRFNPLQHWLVYLLSYLNIMSFIRASLYTFEFTYIEITRLTLSYTTASIAIILLSILLKSAFSSQLLIQSLGKKNNKMQFWLARKIDDARIALRWRGSRVIIIIGRVILLTIFLIFLSIGLVASINTLDEKIFFAQTRSFTGQATPLWTYAFLVDPDNETLYAGTSSGIFRSTDGGQTWQAAKPGTGFISTNVNALLQDSRDGTLYAGTRFGVISSPDGGWSWEPTAVLLPYTNVNALLQDSRDGTLYAGTDAGLIRSTDEGLRWRVASAGLTNTSVNALLQNSRDGTLYAGTDGGIFRSIDGGQTWQAASAGLTNTNVNALLQDSRDGTLYAGARDGIFRSTDGGKTWQATSIGLNNTSVNALLQDSRDGILFAGTDGGIFLSTDDGQSWQAASAGLINTNVFAFLQDSRDGTLFAGTDGGIFRSTDRGRTWQAASTGLTNTNVNALLQDSRDGTLYASTNGGIYRSTDRGETWQAASVGLTNTNVNALLQDSRDGTLYAGARDGIFRSTDGGKTWQATSAGLPDTGLIHVYALLQDSRDGTLYAGTNGGVFRSTDGGQTWQAANAGLPNTGTGLNVNALLQDSRDGTLYAGIDGGIGIFRSTDGGQTWQAASVGLTNRSVNALLQDSRNGTLYTGTDGGVFRSADGGQTWEPASEGFTVTRADTLLQDSRDSTLYAWTRFGVLSSPDGGQTWQAASKGLPDTRLTNVIALLQDSRDGTLYAGTDAGLLRSTDEGQTWQTTSAGLTNTSVNALLQNSRDGTLYAGTGRDIFHSTDGGQSWQAASAGLTNRSVNALLQDSRNSALYAGTDNNDLFDDGGIYRSTDGGQTWQTANAGLTNRSVNALLQDSRNGTLYAGTDGGIFRSTDDGQSWQAANAGLPDTGLIYVYVLLQDSRDGTLFAGVDGYIFRSTDEGQTWQAAHAGIPDTGLFNTNINALLQDSRDGTLYANTDRGIFRSTDRGKNWSRLLSFDSEMSYDIENAYLSYLFAPKLWIFNPDLPFEAFENVANYYPQAAQFAKTGTYYHAWGATIMEIKTEPFEQPAPSPLWALIAWKELWFEPRWMYFAGYSTLVLALWILVTYGNAVWALEIHPLKFLRNKASIHDYLGGIPAPAVLEKWHSHTQNELVTFGNVLPEDLLTIPLLLRKAILKTYLERYDEIYALQSRRRGLVLMAGKPLREWRASWRNTAYDFESNQGLSTNGQVQVNRLAQAFCDVLGFSLGEHRESPSLCAWQIGAPALRLNLPERFPAIFLADPNPNAETVRKLVDTAGLFNGKSNFSLVIPLETPYPHADLPQIVRRLVESSPYAHDFIVLSQQDVIDILIARHPERTLVRHISRQVDLSFISPFVVNGPVPPQMFFGRDKEIRTLVDHAGKRNFAVVGNRKIGKTSLLNQIEARLEQQGNVRLIRMDCQSVREATDFYSAFQKAFGLNDEVTVPAALIATLREQRKQAALPLVLMLDEVDALLGTEKTQGEPLLAAMRELANENTCSFIFCGSKILVKQLRAPESTLFNFPEALALAYLSRAEMDEVITRPLETLGIQITDTPSVLEAVWSLISGHPNLTQFVGRALVNAANDNSERSVTRQDVESLETDPDFVKFYFDTVWGAATPLERLITLAMPSSDFRAGDVEKALRAVGVSVSSTQVDAALETLLVYAVLDRNGKAYHFIPRAFQKLLDLNYETERLVAQEIANLTGENP